MGYVILGALCGYLIMEVYYLKQEVKVHCRSLQNLWALLVEERLTKGVQEGYVGPAAQDPFRIEH